MRYYCTVVMCLIGSMALAVPPEETDKLTSVTPEEAETLLCTDDQCRPVTLTRTVVVTMCRPEERVKTLIVNEQPKEVKYVVQVPDRKERQFTYTINVRGDVLSLNGVKELSPDVARVLARHHGHLHLNRLSSLTPELASVLASTTALISLNGLETISHDAANALVEHRGGWGLGGLKHIDLCTFETLRSKATLPHSLTIESAGSPIVVWKVAGGSPFSQFRRSLADQSGLPVNVDKKAFEKHGVSLQQLVAAPPTRVMWQSAAIEWLAQELSKDHPGAIVAVNSGSEIRFQEGKQGNRLPSSDSPLDTSRAQ